MKKQRQKTFKQKPAASPCEDNYRRNEWLHLCVHSDKIVITVIMRKTVPYMNHKHAAMWPLPDLINIT